MFKYSYAEENRFLLFIFFWRLIRNRRTTSQLQKHFIFNAKNTLSGRFEFVRRTNIPDKLYLWYLAVRRNRARIFIAIPRWNRNRIIFLLVIESHLWAICIFFSQHFSFDRMENVLYFYSKKRILLFSNQFFFLFFISNFRFYCMKWINESTEFKWISRNVFFSCITISVYCLFDVRMCRSAEGKWNICRRSFWKWRNYYSSVFKWRHFEIGLSASAHTRSRAQPEDDIWKHIYNTHKTFSSARESIHYIEKTKRKLKIFRKFSQNSLEIDSIHFVPSSSVVRLRISRTTCGGEMWEKPI